MGPALALCGGEYTHASGHVVAYHLVISADWMDFEVSLNNKLQEGWHPWYGMSCPCPKAGEVLYVQAMVRYR
jgi:hypothetical protein